MSKVPDDRLSEWNKYWDDGSMTEMHAHKPHTKVLAYLDQLTSGHSTAKLFFPLCGDVVDMAVCAERGHAIVGLECSQMGVEAFFTQQNIQYDVEDCVNVDGKLFKSTDTKYNIRIYCCDLFKFNASLEGKFDAILDFGSMGAIYKPDLPAYAQLMKSLMAPGCKHLLECFLYDLNKYPDSLPNCFTLQYLNTLFGDQCDVEKLEEGPNPYTECEANLSDKSFKKEEDQKQCEKEQEEFPDITGAAYFMIKPKQA